MRIGGNNPYDPGRGVILGSSARSKRVATTSKRDLLTWWIDDLGRWNRIDGLCRSEDRILDSSLGGQMMYRFYGMVRLEEAPHRLACHWDVKHAYAGALDVAGSYLRQAGLPVKLHLYFGGWQEELYADPELAYQRLESCRAYAQAEPFTRPLVVRRPLIEARDARRPYGKLLRALEASGGIVTPQLLHSFRCNGLLRRLVLFEESRLGGSLLIRHIGPHSTLARFYGAHWAKDARNRCFEQEVSALGHRPSDAAAYRTTLESGEARFDHIRAPLARGAEELRWISYKRLLVPHLFPNGKRGLMLLSDFSRSVAVPFMGWLPEGPTNRDLRAA